MPCFFQSATYELTRFDEDDLKLEVTLDVCYIEKKYSVGTEYFDWGENGVIGLCPVKTKDSNELKKQFLYQVANT